MAFSMQQMTVAMTCVLVLFMAMDTMVEARLSCSVMQNEGGQFVKKCVKRPVGASVKRAFGCGGDDPFLDMSSSCLGKRSPSWIETDKRAAFGCGGDDPFQPDACLGKRSMVNENLKRAAFGCGGDDPFSPDACLGKRSPSWIETDKRAAFGCGGDDPFQPDACLGKK